MSLTEDPAGQGGGSATDPETGDVRTPDESPEETDRSSEEERPPREEEDEGAGQGSAGGRSSGRLVHLPPIVLRPGTPGLIA
jgi:hypothetical protein